MTVISTKFLDSTGAPAVGDIFARLTSPVPLVPGLALPVQSRGAVINGQIKSLNGAPFELPPTPEGVAIELCLELVEPRPSGQGQNRPVKHSIRRTVAIPDQTSVEWDDLIDVVPIDSGTDYTIPAWVISLLGEAVDAGAIAATARDEAVAAAASVPDASYVAANYVAKGSVVVDVADFGVVADGVTDNTAAVQSVINAAADRATIVAPKGATLKTSGWTVPTGKSIDIDFRNAHIVRTSTAPVLDATGTFGTPTTVTGATTESVSIVVGSAAGLAVGDLIKIYSDDIIADSRPGDHLDTNNPATTAYFARKGEHAVVTSIAGTTIGINPPLYDTYTTNVRAAKMNKQQVTFRFATMDHAGLAATQDMMASVRFTGLRTPRVEGTILSAPLGAVELNGTFGAKVDIEVHNLPAGPGGYGVQSRGSVRGDIKVNSNRLRHAYTDDVQWQQNGSPSTNPANYGRAMYDTITGKSVSSSATSFDTHHGGYAHRFVNCLAVGNSESSGTGYSLRGQSHEFVNCAANSLAVGFRVFDEGDFDWATSRGHRMIGCSSNMGARQAIYVDMSRYGSPEDGPNLTISGGVFESHDGNALRLLNARVHAVGPVLRHTKPGRPSAYNSFISGGVYALTGSLMVNLSRITTGTMDCIIQTASGTSTYDRVLNLDITAVLGTYLRSNLTVLARFNSFKGQVRWTLDGPTTAVPIGTATLTPPDQSTIVKTIGVGATPSTTTGASASRAYNWSSGALHSGSAADPVVKHNIHVSANVSTTSIAAGAFDGQQLIIRARADNGAFTLTVTHGSGASTDLGGSNVVLAAGQTLRLMWDAVDSLWIKLA